MRYLNALTGQNIYFDAAIIFFATYFPFVFAFLHWLYFWRCRKVWPWFLSATVAVIGYALQGTISLFYFRIRPFGVLDGVNNLLGKSIKDASFPSSHTVVAFALAFGIFWINKKYGAAFLAGAFLIALSRVVAGVHYPTDILAGIIFAFLLSLVVRQEAKKKK